MYKEKINKFIELLVKVNVITNNVEEVLRTIISIEEFLNSDAGKDSINNFMRDDFEEEDARNWVVLLYLRDNLPEWVREDIYKNIFSTDTRWLIKLSRILLEDEYKKELLTELSKYDENSEVLSKKMEYEDYVEREVFKLCIGIENKYLKVVGGGKSLRTRYDIAQKLIDLYPCDDIVIDEAFIDKLNDLLTEK
jgi:hypothetical protein